MIISKKKLTEEEDIGEQIISKLKELEEEIDRLRRSSKNGRNELPDSSCSGNQT